VLAALCTETRYGELARTTIVGPATSAKPADNTCAVSVGIVVLLALSARLTTMGCGKRSVTATVQLVVLLQVLWADRGWPTPDSNIPSRRETARRRTGAPG
jgi:hypothetical protein